MGVILSIYQEMVFYHFISKTQRQLLSKLLQLYTQSLQKHTL